MIEIINYKAVHAKAFREINEEWIKKYFKMEETDYKSLHHPKEYILDRGGFILVATEHDEAIGVCAMIKTQNSNYDFELAKMGVRPIAHRRGIGYLLGKAVIKKAKSMGAKKIYLETNTILGTAIKLYLKLGFTEVKDNPSPYERCNFQMELNL